MSKPILCPFSQGLAPNAFCTLPANHPGAHDITAVANSRDVCGEHSRDGDLRCDLHHDHRGPHATGHEEWTR